MSELFLTPPLAFVSLLLFSWLTAIVASFLAFRRSGEKGALTKSYASGENVKTGRVTPDYGQFFPFAFFFTILHVVALMTATVPTATLGSLVIAVIYIGGALFGLFMLFRK